MHRLRTSRGSFAGLSFESHPSLKSNDAVHAHGTFDWAAMGEFLFLRLSHWLINVFNCAIYHVLAYFGGTSIHLRAALANRGFLHSCGCIVSSTSPPPSPLSPLLAFGAPCMNIGL